MLPTALFPSDRAFVSPETFDAFFATMERLDHVIIAETLAMRRHDHRGLTESARQKRQGLLELNRIMRLLQGTIPSQEILARLKSFQAKLLDNDAALGVELAAAKAVTDTIVRVMREMESDGTYSRAHGRHGYDAR